ncbi:MAG: hypothetical protein ACRCUI_09930 [Polymorphobacter sp.]
MAAGADRTILELHLAVREQLFNSMDPAPFRQRDLDPAVVTYIVDWAEALPGNAPLGVAITLEQASASGDDAAVVRDAFEQKFRLLAASSRLRLRRLFRDGRISLVIGLAFVAVAVIVSELVTGFVAGVRVAQLVHDSVVIAAWVALWFPVNIFLFEWWPILGEARMFDRLSQMPVTCDTAAIPAP